MLVDIGLIPLTAAVFLITGLVVGNEGVRKLRMTLKRLSWQLKRDRRDFEIVKTDAHSLELKLNRLRAQINSAVENKNMLRKAEKTDPIKIKMVVDS